jgi:hypothetical protein
MLSARFLFQVKPKYEKKYFRLQFLIVQVGASGALFGFMGVLLTDLIQNWAVVPNRCRALLGQVFVVVIAFAIGIFLPGGKFRIFFCTQLIQLLVDNFAHLGGFVMGLFCGFIFIPSLGYGTCKARWRTLLTCLALPITLSLFIAGFLGFYLGVNVAEFCPGCEQITCLSFLPWCQTKFSTL